MPKSDRCWHDRQQWVVEAAAAAAAAWGRTLREGDCGGWWRRVTTVGGENMVIFRQPEHLQYFASHMVTFKWSAFDSGSPKVENWMAFEFRQINNNYSALIMICTVTRERKKRHEIKKKLTSNSLSSSHLKHSYDNPDSPSSSKWQWRWRDYHLRLNGKKVKAN